MSWSEIQGDDKDEITCVGSSSSLDIVLCKVPSVEEEFAFGESMVSRPLAGYETTGEPTKVGSEGEFAGPWLPQRVKQMLNKLRLQGQLSPDDLLKLMNIVSSRTIEHYELPKGKFVAITITGKIVELTDNKLELLRKTQGKKFSEPIFFWRVGREAFSGRL
jgi:hypothetical protein